MTTRKLGSLIDPQQKLHSVPVPDASALTQNVEKHLATVQENVVKGYQSILSTIQAQEQASMSDYAYRMQKERMNAQGSGSDFGNALTQVSKVLVDSYGAFQETKNISKELEIKANIAKADIENQKLSYEQKLVAEQFKQEQERLKLEADNVKANIIQQIDQSITQSEELIRQYGWSEGTTKAQAQIQTMFESPEFQNLPPEHRVQITTYYRSHFGDIQKQQTQQAVQRQKEYEAESVDRDINVIRASFGASVLADLENGVNPDSAVSRFEEGVAKWEKNIEQRTGKPLDPLYKMKVLNPLYKDLNERLVKMYGDTAKNFSVAGKYVELEEYAGAVNLLLQNQAPDPSTGQPITDARVRQLIKEKAIQLGIPAYTEELEYTKDKIESRQIDSLERARKIEELLNSSDTPIDPESIMGQRTLNASSGSTLFSAINEDAGTRALISHIKNNRSQYPAHLQNLPELLDEFKVDRKGYSDIGQELAKLEQKYVQLSAETNPELLGQRRVLVPPNPELGTDGGYVDVQGVPSPTALQEQRDSLLKQMESLKSQQVELQTKWQAYGLDVVNPSNRDFLNKLEAQTMGVTQEAERRLPTEPPPIPTSGGGVPKEQVVRPPTITQQQRSLSVHGAGREAVPNLYDKDGNLAVPEATVGKYAPYISGQAKAYGVSGRDSNLATYYLSRAYTGHNRILGKALQRIEKGEDSRKVMSEARAELQNFLDKDLQNEVTVKFGDTFVAEDIKTSDPSNPTVFGHNTIKATLLKSFKEKEAKFLRSFDNRVRRYNVVSSRPTEAPRNPSVGTHNPSPQREYPRNDNSLGRVDGMVSPLNGTNFRVMSIGGSNANGIPNGVTYSVSGKQNVHSVSDGTVVYVGTHNNKPITIIKTSTGVFEGYTGLNQNYYKRGDKVKAGSPIGHTGGSSTSGGVLGGGLVNPIRNGSDEWTSQDYATGIGQENKFRTHKGIDIMVPQGTDVYSPVSGTVVYAERGHTVNTEDSMPNTSGYQPQHSVLLKLDKPIVQNGRSYNMVYMTHLGSVENLPVGSRVTPNTRVGVSGVAGGAGHVHLGVIGDRQQQTYLPEGTLYQHYRGGGKDEETSIVVWNSNPVLSNGIVSTNTANARDYLTQKSGGYYPANGVNRRQGTSPNSVYKVSEGVFLLPNGRVFDMKTNSLRMPTNNETKARNSGFKPSVQRNTKNMSTKPEDYGTGANNPEEDYGYDILRKDPDFRKAVADLADELNIPAVFLVDVFAYETGGWTHIKTVNEYGYWGLIQISPTNIQAYSKMSQAQASKLSLGDQVRQVVRPYLLAMQRESGRKIRTLEDVLFSIWNGYTGLLKTPEQRLGLTDSLNGTKAMDYLNRVGSHAGRSYNHIGRNRGNRASVVHNYPRDGCPECQRLLNLNSFGSHYV